MSNPKTIGEVLGLMKNTKSYKEFRRLIKTEIVDFYRLPDSKSVIADPKFVAYITGLLYFAIHDEWGAS